MKKILLLVGLCCLILSTTAFAHVRTAAEPEWDGYYSLTNQTITKPFWGGARLQYGFTKYTNGKTTEYWFRLDKNKDEDKLLPYATLIIDDVAYPIEAIKSPSVKYTEAGLSLIDVAIGTKVMQQGVIRYFPLSDDLINKIKSAKRIQLKFDTVDRINRIAVIPSDLLEAMQITIDTPFEEIKKQWQPKDDELKDNPQKEEEISFADKIKILSNN